MTGLLTLVVTSMAFGQVQFDGKTFLWPAYMTPRDAYFGNNITREVETPHLTAAVPYAGGKVKVFFISPRRLVRPTIELCQRFDIEERYALTDSRNAFGDTRPLHNTYRRAGAQRQFVLKDIANALAWEPDVIFLHQIDLSILPLDVQQEILERVDAGAGLVCWRVRPGDEPGPLAKALGHRPDAGATNAILSAIPQRMRYRFSGTAAHRPAKTSRMVQILDAPADELFSYLHEEDLYAVIGKAVLWAAFREGPTTMDISLDQKLCRVTQKRADLEDPVLTLEIYDPSAVFRHQREYVADIPLSTDVPMPPLKAGPHWVKLTLRSGGEVVDFQHRMFDVTAPVNVGEITFVKEHVTPGEMVQATISVEGKSLSDYQFVYELADTYDRVFHRGTEPAEPQITISAPVEDCLSPVCFLVARLVMDGHTVAEQRKWFTVEQPHIDTEDFHALLWGSKPMWGDDDEHSIWGYELSKRVKAMGIDFLMTTGHPGKGVWPPAMGNLRPYGYAINHGLENESNIRHGGPVRQPCLTSPDYREQVANERLRYTASSLWRYSPLAYTNCGDTVLSYETDLCFSDTCIANFRTYLKSRYRNVAELNAIWDTRYDNISQVTPVTLATLEDRRAAAKNDSNIQPPAPGEYARWLEHRLHMETVYGDLHLHDADAVRKYDTDAKYGIDAMTQYTSAYAGFDFLKLFERVKFFGPYFHPFDFDIGRSFSRPGSLLGSWVGGYAEYRTEECSRLFAWKLLFHGFNMQMFFILFNDDGASHPCSLMAPDLRPYPTMSDQIEELREIRGGTGRLLRSAHRENDGLAFLYSPESVHATTITRGVPKQEFARVEGVAGKTGMHASDQFEYISAAEGLGYLFTDMGFQFDYVSPAQVADGRLARGGFRMLVLPSAQALSKPVVEAIRQFVSDGGIVLADLRPGIFDEHGRLLGKGQLDDVFGIDRPEGFPEKPQVRSVKPVNGDDAIATLAIDHEVELTDAKALAHAHDKAVFIRKQHRSGTAFLLNFWPGHYVALRTMGSEMPLRDFVEDMLADVGVAPQVRITAVDGKVPCTEAVRYSHGDNMYVGLLRSPRLRVDEAVTNYDRRPRWATIDFGRSGHVYDMRKGKYIGQTDRVEALIAPARALLYAILPYQVRRVDVSQRGSADPRDRVFDITAIASNGDAATHVFHVSVVDTTGRERPEYARNVKAHNGRITMTLRLALSDPAGIWKLTARDTASGHVGHAAFEVRPPTGTQNRPPA